MSNKVKDINKKKPNILLFQRYYQYRKIQSESYWNRKKLIQRYTYLTIKEYVKTCSVNPVYLYGYFYEIDGDKYSALVFTNKSKEEKIWRYVE